VSKKLLEDAKRVSALYMELKDGKRRTISSLAKELDVPASWVRGCLAITSTPLHKGGVRQKIRTIDDLKAACDVRDGPPQVLNMGAEGPCWLWRGSCDDFGYGTLSFGGKSIRVHQLALKLTGVKVPPRTPVVHTCASAHCCNPDHLTHGHKDSCDIAEINRVHGQALDRSRGNPERIKRRRKTGPVLNVDDVPDLQPGLAVAIETVSEQTAPPAPAPAVPALPEPGLEPVGEDIPVIAPIIKAKPAAG